MSEIETKESLIHLQESLRGKVEHAEAWFNFGLSMASMVGVVIIPLIPASLTFMSVASEFPHLLHIPQGMAYFVGAITAIGLEFLALLTIRTALRMLKYNQEATAFNKLPDLRPDEHLQTAPAGQGVVASAVYTIIVLSLVVLLKIYPAAVLWALIPMSLMALVAEWAFLLSVDQSERELRRRQAEVTRGRIDEITQLNATISELQQHIADHEVDAQALQERVEHAQRLNAEQLNTFNAERQQLQRQIEQLTTQLIAQQSAVVQQTVEQSGNVDERSTVLDTGRQIAIEQKQIGKAERQQKLLNILMTELNNAPADMLNKSVLAERLNTTHTTISRDLNELCKLQRLSINGHIAVL
jgi:hypothetical protein